MGLLVAERVCPTSFNGVTREAALSINGRGADLGGFGEADCDRPDEDATRFNSVVGASEANLADISEPEPAWSDMLAGSGLSGSGGEKEKSIRLSLGGRKCAGRGGGE